jgi:hypothetical protein
MRELVRKLGELLPLQFRVLYRQFLLRVIDLEALSAQADIPRFLGQFASILIFISLIGAIGLLFSNGAATATRESYLSFVWRGEQALVSGMMLVIGLVTVISWDSTFPDRRDIMVLSPLPVKPHTILIAKVAASATLLGLSILTLNFATGVAWPLLIGSHHGSLWGYADSLAAYWLTMIAASVFIFCSVLTVQGLSALLLPRRLFLAFSAFLQVAAFGLFLGGYFLQPTLDTPVALAAAENHWLLAWSPSFWFFALFNQVNGSLPSNFDWLASRAWIGLAIVVSGASASLLLCYLRTMKKTVEAPDLVRAARSLRWTPRFGGALHTAIVLFSLRSLVRSRQHRVAFAFYLAVIVSIALYWLRIVFSSPAHSPLPAEFLEATIVMMSLAVFGMRSVFSLPISLTANWVLRTTQLSPPEKYVAATRRTLLLLAVIPTWVISAGLSTGFRPLHSAAVHLALLALLGWVFVELSLIGFYKVPFTCSYLPGKVHVQVVFWCFLLLLVVFALVCAEYELPALSDPIREVGMTAVLAAAGAGLWAFNRQRAKSAVLYYEELPPEVITQLGLVWIPRSGSRVNRDTEGKGLDS